MAQSSERAIRFGLIGAGAIMRLSHAPAIARHPATMLAAVHDPDPGRAEALAGATGAQVFPTLGALLERPEIDAVVVATPNRFHAEAVIAAAAAGKHVLCEKPLAMSVQEARAMVDACREAGVVLQVGFNQRFWPQVQIARSLIEAGVIGDVLQVQSVYAEKAGAYPAATRYRYDLAQSGGATIIDLTIHRIDLVRYLVGDVTAVFADLANSALPERVDDNVWILTRFANGARGCLSGNRFSPDIGDGTDIRGSRGTIHLATETVNPFHGAPVAVYTEARAEDLPPLLREAVYPEAWWKGFEGGWITLKPPRPNPYDLQLEAFLTTIHGGRSEAATGEDGLRAQEIVQAAYLAFDKGTWVDCPLPADAPLIIPDYGRGAS
jgi:predicted dehydrogenase